MKNVGEAVDIRGETVARSSARDVLLVTLVPLLLLFVLNIPAKAYLARESWVHRIDSEKWQSLRTAQDTDWLVLGDSTGLMGVMPAVLRRELRGQVLNLARNAGPVCMEDAWMADEFLRQRGSPKGVVVVYSYHTLQALVPNWEAGLASMPLEFLFWRRRNPPLATSWSEDLNVVYHHLLPLSTDRRTLARPFLEPWAPMFEGASREHLGEDGFLEAAPNPSKVEWSAEQHLEGIKENPAALHPVQETGLNHLGRLADEKGFQVFFAPGPAWAGLRENPVFRQTQQAYRERVEQLARAHPGHVHFVLPTKRFFEKDEMESDVHLTRRSAARYTEALGQAVWMRQESARRESARRQ